VPSGPWSTLDVAAYTAHHFVTRAAVCFAAQRIILSELRSDELAADSLMEPLLVIKADVLLDHVSKMPLAEEDEVPQTLGFDWFNKSLCVRIAVRASGRNLHALNTLAIAEIGWLQDRLEPVREERVGVMNQVLCVAQESVGRVGETASDLLHPLTIWMQIGIWSGESAMSDMGYYDK
jgi:hypothetical protein